MNHPANLLKTATSKIPVKLRYIVFGAIIALVTVIAIVGIKIQQFSAMGAAAAQFVMPPEPVNVVEVQEQPWQPRLAAVGTVAAVQGTIVSAEAEGIVRQISFEPGSLVAAGKALVQLDTDIEEAQLRAAEAASEDAHLNFKRAKELITSNSISQSDFSSATVALKKAEAEVDNIRAVIARKTVRAPFAGKLGIRQISIGDFLHKGDPVVSLQSPDPVFVDFSLPQQRLSEITKGLEVVVSSDARPNQPFVGKITAINPNVDIATRNVRVQATLANPNGHLRPGMFVSIEMLLNRLEGILFIPASAVLHSPFGDTVFVVEEAQEAGPDGKKPLVVQQQLVNLGMQQGDFIAVTKGIKAGERIVSAGAFKLRPGTPVVIDNTLAPDFSFNPKPDNT